MSLRQELAVILMDHVDGMRDSTYKNILEELGKIPDHKDPTSALELQKELKRQQSENRMLEDSIFDCQDQLDAQEQYIRNANASLTLMTYRVVRLENEYRLERHRNIDLHRRVLNYQKLLKVPKSSCSSKEMYSITDIPTGVYFATDQLERSSLKAVQDMFTQYDRLYKDRMWADKMLWFKRNEKKSAEIYSLQHTLDSLTKKLQPVKPFYLFMREGRNLSEENVNIKEWGRRWREEVSDTVKSEIVKRASHTYRVVYPYNKNRNSKEYQLYPTKNQKYRASLGLMEQIRFDINCLQKRGLDTQEDETQLSIYETQVSSILSKILSIQESINADRVA